MEKIKIKDKKLGILIYDISDDKLRNRFVKLVSSFGQRVQKSAFEIDLSNPRINELYKRIPSNLGDEDSIILYKVDGNVKSWGCPTETVSYNTIVIF